MRSTIPHPTLHQEPVELAQAPVESVQVLSRKNRSIAPKIRVTGVLLALACIIRHSHELYHNGHSASLACAQYAMLPKPYLCEVPV